MGRSLSVFAFVLVLAAAGFGQASWLDKTEIENWNEKKITVPAPPKYPADELSRCGHTLRPATLIADKVLTNVGWKLVGSAQVWGSTQVVQVTREFDGQCRTIGYQYFVFVENKIVGTLSPKLMDSRTDGALFQVELFNVGELRAQYSRYQESDALCCPSKTDVVYFSINDTENGKVLVPNDKMTIGGEESGTAKGPSLEGTKWKWTGFQSPVEDISVIEPDRYTLEFGENSSLRVQADCNKGAGTYTLDGSSLTFSPVATTRRACPDGSQDALFLKDLQWVRIVKVEGNDMYLDLFADGGTMKFTRVE